MADPTFAYSEERHGQLRHQLGDTLLTLMRAHDAVPD
jgi:hypothetical protein